MDSAEKHVVILDPALRELGGHHPATLQSLAESVAVKNGSLSIEVFANTYCSESYAATISKSKVIVNLHFNTDFYQYFYQKVGLAEIQPYIRTLAKEYLAAFNLSLAKYANKPVLFWCHTLGWQHAYALSLALQMLEGSKTAEPDSSFKVAVGLMYSPYDNSACDSVALGLSLKQQMNFELSFRSLAMQHSVTFFAADYELKLAYQRLLNRDIAIQPCLLLGSATAGKELIKSEKNQMLLYTGDAKINKGYTQLPRITEQLVKACPEMQFVIQYTITNDSKELADVQKKLLSLQASFNNVSIINKFISHQELMSLFASSKAILFNYDEDTYRNQSSGVLWLAAFYQLNIICLTNTWVSREAVRLGAASEVCSSKDSSLEFMVTDSTKLKSQHNKDQVDIEYKEELFQDIDLWVQSQFAPIVN